MEKESRLAKVGKEGTQEIAKHTVWHFTGAPLLESASEKWKKSFCSTLPSIGSFVLGKLTGLGWWWATAVSLLTFGLMFFAWSYLRWRRAFTLVETGASKIPENAENSGSIPSTRSDVTHGNGGAAPFRGEFGLNTIQGPKIFCGFRWTTAGKGREELMAGFPPAAVRFRMPQETEWIQCNEFPKRFSSPEGLLLKVSIEKDRIVADDHGTPAKMDLFVDSGILIRPSLIPLLKRLSSRNPLSQLSPLESKLHADARQEFDGLTFAQKWAVVIVYENGNIHQSKVNERMKNLLSPNGDQGVEEYIDHSIVGPLRGTKLIAYDDMGMFRPHDARMRDVEGFLDEWKISLIG